MVKTFIALCLTGSMLFSSAEALLPPFYEGLKEIEAILNDKELQKRIPSGDSFVKLEKTKDGYLFVTNQREVEIKVIYENSGMIGPAKFNLEFSGGK